MCGITRSTSVRRQTIHLVIAGIIYFPMLYLFTWVDVKQNFQIYLLTTKIDTWWSVLHLKGE